MTYGTVADDTCFGCYKQSSAIRFVLLSSVGSLAASWWVVVEQRWFPSCVVVGCCLAALVP